MRIRFLPAVAVVLATVLLVSACASPAERAAKYVASAQVAFDRGDIEEARLNAANAAQIEPKNAGARLLLALVAEKKLDFKDMYGHLLVAVDSDPSNVEARLKLADVAVLGLLWDEAAKQSEALMKLAPDDSRVRLLKARIDLQNGDKTAGRAELEKAIALDPQNVNALVIQAALVATTDLDQGIALLDAGIRRLPADKARALRERRVILLSSAKRHQEAEQGLKALVKDYPDEPAYGTRLINLYVREGRTADADQLLQQSLAQTPGDTDKRIDYARFLASQQENDRAEAALKSFIDDKPESDPLRLALGQLHESTGQRAEAKTTYAALAKLRPTSPDGIKARLRIAIIESGEGNGAKAIEDIEAILANVPDEPTALLLRAAVKVNQQQYNEAIADLRVALRKEPENQPAVLLLAKAHTANGDAVLAKDEYRKLLKVNPGSADAITGLVALYIDSKEFDQAEQLLNDRLKSQPDDLVAGGALVDVLLAEGRQAEAETEARRLMALPNQQGVGDYALGRVLQAQKGQGNAAVAAFRRSVAARPNDAAPLQALVQALMTAGKQQEAIDALKELQQNAANPGGQLLGNYLLAGIYSQSGDRGKAVASLESILKNKPDAIEAYYALAQLNEKDLPAQIAIYKRGVAAVPANEDLSLLLGAAQDQAGQYDAAIATYEALLKVNPSSQSGINNLASALLDHRQDKDSFQRALSLAKRLEGTTNPALLDTVGWAYFRTGNGQQAVNILERVVAKDDQVPVYRYHLGMAYLAVGNQANAKQQLEKAVAGNASYLGIDEARAALAKLDKAA